MNWTALACVGSGVGVLCAGLIFAGRYKLVELLGSGGMSQVWRARDDVLGRFVAVKVLTADLTADKAREESTRDLLRREARAMAKVNSAHVAGVHDYGEHDADGVILPFVVMEIVHGRTLARALSHGPLPWPDAVRMAAQVASGLAAAHEHGVIHCDVTPANVVLTRAGVKVVDFGIATVMGANHLRTRFGTAGYAAPECYDQQAALTPAVDVYALGVVLCEALTGRPLDDPDRLAVVVPEVPSAVAALCRRCLAESPADRPSANEAAAVLATLHNGLSRQSTIHDGLHERAVVRDGLNDRAVVRDGPEERAAVHNGFEKTPSGTTPEAVGTRPGRRTRALPTALLKQASWRRRASVAAIGVALAGLVCLLTLALVSLAFLVLGSGRGVQVAAPPQLSSSADAAGGRTGGPARLTPTPRPVPTPTGRGDNATADLRQAVLAGRAAGEIRPQCAESLLSRIDDLQRRIDRGDRSNARQGIEKIGEEIDERASEGEVTRARATSLRQALAAVEI